MWVEVRYKTHRLGLLVRQGRLYVISVASLGICGEIVLGGKDLVVQRLSVQISRICRVRFYSYTC